ncbi:MAG: peroxidase family protein [Deltaproteobacteria bacterium]|nr:peroxidase family protein [Deltaproteobacteria bacterium]
MRIQPASVPFNPVLTIENLRFGDAVRSFSGQRNNLSFLPWGAAKQPLLRRAAAAYSDGVSAPAGANRPSARALSLAAQTAFKDSRDFAQVSDLFTLWGQFIAHCLVHTPEQSGDDTELMQIPIPNGDPHFGRDDNLRPLALRRSQYVNEGKEGKPREQTNKLSSFLDGTAVYGSTPERARDLRASGNSGKLRVSKQNDGDWLPYNTNWLFNVEGPGVRDMEASFIAGDVRANENIALTAMHSLWVREHNRLCDQISDSNPQLSGDEIYHCARKIVEALIQKITYAEYLPLLLGGDGLGPYKGYDRYNQPGIYTEFSTAAFRLGHPMVHDDVYLLSVSEYVKLIPLKDAFFRPDIAVKHGLDEYFRGANGREARALNLHVVDALSNQLFQHGPFTGLDLFAFNVQRGRDHGLASLNAVREAYGLSVYDSVDQVSVDPRARQVLSAYDDVMDIDLWVGGLAERPRSGAVVGPSFAAILAHQFSLLRSADRFWYQNDAFFADNPDALAIVNDSTLSDVIKRNTGASLPSNAFIVPSGF